MPIEFRCPICTKLLRVPDGTEGRQAKCPECGNMIAIPEASSGSAVEVPPLLSGGWEGQVRAGGYASAGSPPPRWPQSAWGPTSPSPSPAMPGEFPAGPGSLSPQQYLAHSKVSGPATGMMVLSILHIVVTVIPLLMGILGLGIAAEEGGPHGQDEKIIDFSPTFFGFLIGLALAIVVLLGAIRMKNMQSYGLAMTAAILSIIPCTSPCCFLIGTPIGIWALVVLNDPAVKAAFR